jgi:hypothetical protein
MTIIGRVLIGILLLGNAVLLGMYLGSRGRQQEAPVPPTIEPPTAVAQVAVAPTVPLTFTPVPSTDTPVPPPDTPVPPSNTPVPPTDTPVPPTDTPVPPTPTEIPTDTPIPTVVQVTATPMSRNTPAGTILEIDQSWHQDGVEIRLENRGLVVEPQRKGISFIPRFSNKTTADIVVSYEIESNLTATDNLGNRLEVHDYAGGTNTRQCGQQTQVVYAGSSTRLTCNSMWNGVMIHFDVGNANITEILFTVSNVSRIEKAQWRIPVNS